MNWNTKKERRPTFNRLWGALKYDKQGLHGREPGERREKWGRKGTPYTCFGEFQNIASHAHRLSHCTWVKQSTGNSGNMPQEPKLALWWCRIDPSTSDIFIDLQKEKSENATQCWEAKENVKASWCQGCILLTSLSVISSKFIQKFAQKCQYFTLIDQSIPPDNCYVTCLLREESALVHLAWGWRKNYLIQHWFVLK